MSDFNNKLEELKERRSDAFNGIASSIIDKNETIEVDNTNNRYLFGDTRNAYGILDLLYWYQKERVLEYNLMYNDLLSASGLKVNKSSLVSKISSDIRQVTGMEAPSSGWKYTNNWFYKIDKDYNASINYGKEGATEYNKNSLFFNGGEDNSNKRIIYKDTQTTLGERYTEDNAASSSYDVGQSGWIVADAIANRGSGVLKYWNSNNRISLVPPTGGDQGQPGTATIGYKHDGSRKVWAWRTSSGNYNTFQKIADFYTAFKALKTNIVSLQGVLTNLITILHYAENSGIDYWRDILGDVADRELTVLAYKNQIDTIKGEIFSAYDYIKDYETTNVVWEEDPPGSGDSNYSIYTNINSMISALGTVFTHIDNNVPARFNNTATYLGTGIDNGLRKWINFWLTEKISLELGSYSQIQYLNDSIDNEAEELQKIDQRIKTIVTSGDKFIPTPEVKAAYSDPKYDRKSGATTQRRLGVIWDGQFHAKKYHILRKNIKAFDYVHPGNFYFFNNNADWTNIMFPSNPSIPNQEGNEKTFVNTIDPDYGFISTEYLEGIDNEETYIYRVYVEDENTVDPNTYDFKNVTSLSGLKDPYIGANPVRSYQSKIYDPEQEYSFTKISNGVINLANNPFRKGSFILIKSNINPPEYDQKKITINGIHRVIDFSEDSIVLEGLPETSFPGKFYPVFGVVTAKNIPIITYQNDGKPEPIVKQTSGEPSTQLGEAYVRRDGSSTMTGDWNAGDYTIINKRFEVNEFNLNGIEFQNTGAEYKDILRIDDEGNVSFDDLSDKQDATITSSVDPSIYSPGVIGQFWLNTTSQQLFQLVEISGDTYLWKNLSGSGMIRGDTYIHIQNFAWHEWRIEHGLGRYPSVTLVNDNNVVIEGNVKYVDESTIVVTFTTPQTGRAYLNWGKNFTRSYDFTNVNHVTIDDYFDESLFNKHYPSVTIVNTNNEIIEGKVKYSDNDIIDIYFTENVSGTVYLN